MEWHPAPIERRKSRQIKVGNVLIGGNAPISVQSMTSTDTMDVEATVNQIKALKNAGADLVRVTVPTLEACKAFSEIVKRVDIPLISDIHFDYRIAIECAKNGAAALRINPGNIGSHEKIEAVCAAARDYGLPIRVGVNAGSLDKDLLEKYGAPCPDAMVEAALRAASCLDEHNFFDYAFSVKASELNLCVSAYEQLARVTDAPLHLGITEAGGLTGGTVLSSIGISWLLKQGIGDTIRVSLAADPVEEIKVGIDWFCKFLYFAPYIWPRPRATHLDLSALLHRVNGHVAHDLEQVLYSTQLLNEVDVLNVVRFRRLEHGSLYFVVFGSCVSHAEFLAHLGVNHA